MIKIMDRYFQRLQVNILWLRVWLWRRIFSQHRSATLEHVEILYKSSNFIVVDKHYDVKINSDEIKDKVTVALQLAHRFPELVDVKIAHKFRFVHRLDYSTSGAICVALNKKASAEVTERFKKHQVTKCYYALVRGHIQEDFLRISKPIYPNPVQGYTHMMCVLDDENCVPSSGVIKTLSAVTELHVLQRGVYDGQPVTKVLLKPLTGEEKLVQMSPFWKHSL